MKAMGALYAFGHDCGLEQTLLEMIKLRVSQINGCAHCIDMHTKELRAMGIDEQRLYLLNARKAAYPVVPATPNPLYDRLAF